MKKLSFKKTMVGMAMVAILAVSVAAGQRRSHQGMGPGIGQGRGVPMYDPAAEITIAATIEEVNEHAGKMGVMGTHLVVRVDEKTLDVHLGPSTYLADQGFVLAKGDHVELVGSSVKMENTSFLIAREVRKGNMVLPLRDEQGRPAWAGMGGTRRDHKGSGCCSGTR